MQSYAYCVDNTGVRLVKVFQVVGASCKREATLGDLVWVVVRSADTKRGILMRDEKKRWKFRRGSVHKAVVVQVKQKIRRRDWSYIWFRRNSVVLVNRAGLPLGNRIKTPVPIEVANKFPGVGSVCYKFM
jgi:large subunit ribosomal protein L14